MFGGDARFEKGPGQGLPRPVSDITKPNVLRRPGAVFLILEKVFVLPPEASPPKNPSQNTGWAKNGQCNPTPSKKREGEETSGPDSDLMGRQSEARGKFTVAPGPGLAAPPRSRRRGFPQPGHVNSGLPWGRSRGGTERLSRQPSGVRSGRSGPVRGKWPRWVQAMTFSPADAACTGVVANRCAGN